MAKITVGMVLYPGFQLLDIAGPQDALAEVKLLSKGQFEYEIITIGTTRDALFSSGGRTVMPDRTIFDTCPPFDTLIVPGGSGIFDVYDDATFTQWLTQQHQSVRRLAAICNGVFALGAARLINHKVVTTHWMDAARLAAEFPLTTVEPDHIHVKSGSIYTTAGVTAGIDLALLLIEEDFGKALAIAVAKFLVVYLQRAGGQSQFSPLLDLQSNKDTQVHGIQQYLTQNLNLSHSLNSLAERVHMSPRNLSRLFSRETGLSPMAYLNNARVESARRHLENSTLSLKEIAHRCGFESSSALRRVFFKRLSINPLDYRKRFR